VIDWRATEQRRLVDCEPMRLAYTGKGPRCFFKIEGGVMYVGKQDA
jgi:hypothetical protein